MAQKGKNPPVVQEIRVQPLGQEDPLVKGMALQYSCLENPKDKGAWRATVHGVKESQTRLSYHHFHTLCYMHKSDKLLLSYTIRLYLQYLHVYQCHPHNVYWLFVINLSVYLVAIGDPPQGF